MKYLASILSEHFFFNNKIIHNGTIGKTPQSTNSSAKFLGQEKISHPRQTGQAIES